MKKLLLLLTAFLVLPAMSFAQTPWAAKGAFPIGTFPGTTSPKMNWDGHGVAVDPDGKVWYQPYYSTDSTNVKWQAKKVATRVIYVFNPDGTQASFSPIKYVTVGGVVDTLGGVTLTSKNAQGVTVRTFDQNTGRGMRVDQNGNVLVMMFNILYRINYKTGAGMNRVEVNNAGARASGYSTGAPAVDKNGNIFVAPVSPGAGPLKMYDKDFNFIGNARNKTYGFSRSFEVSPDGNTIYWAGYTNHAIYMYRRADEFSPFDSLGIVLAGFDSESLTFNPATGQLWASAGSANDSPNRALAPVAGVLTAAQIATMPKTSWKRRTWYAFDVSKLTPKDLTDKETAIESMTLQPYATADTLARPRGLGFTKDGKTAYTVSFANATGKDASGATVIYPTLQKFTAPVGGRSVTAWLNTSTIPDTVTVNHNIRILGGGGALPDGNNMTWDDKSTLVPQKVTGDYRSYSFQIADNTEIAFKFRDLSYVGSFDDGWEDGSDSKIAAGTGNVDLGTHFFKAKPNGGNAYDWRPFRKVGTDSVGVWFRVFMNTVNAVTHGYDSAKGAPVAIRGDDLAGQSQITWDNKTKVTLKKESQDAAAVGYHIYSGLAVYPKAAIGKTQAFKYFVNNDPNGSGGYEDGSDRKIKVPKSDSTVQWVRFGNSKAITGNAVTVQKNVTFSVDLTPLQIIGMFDRTQGDSLQVRGDFNGWDCAKTAPEKCLLDKVPGAVTYERPVAVKLIPTTAFNYKYYLQYNRGNFPTRFPGRVMPSGWEEPLSTTGSNRTGTFDGTKDQTEKTANFDDIELKNIIPTGKAIDVKFRVDMKPVTKGINSAGAAQPFDPTAGDSVFVSFGDPIWLFTQKLPLTTPGGSPKLNHKFFLVDPDKDGIYEGTLKITGPTYDALQYQYSFGQKASFITEEGGGFSGLGRRRVRFIYPTSNTAKNADGTFSSWPTSQFANKFDAGAEVFTPTGALPFDKNKAGTGSNPVDVDPVDGALPSQVTLSANYPNPFNPSTSFEYTLNRQAQVTVQIYDITGRLVQTLVNEMQGPNTYRVSFDASNMASGVYVYRLQVGDQVLSRKMTFLK
jgi:hypothetical protein